MMTKEQQFKLLEGRIDKMQEIALECVEILSVALWNEAIECAAKSIENEGCLCNVMSFYELAFKIRSLKK